LKLILKEVEYGMMLETTLLFILSTIRSLSQKFEHC